MTKKNFETERTAILSENPEFRLTIFGKKINIWFSMHFFQNYMNVSAKLDRITIILDILGPSASGI